MSISRRDFVSVAAGAGVAAAFPSAGARTPSGLVTGKPVPLLYTEVKGFLGAEQVRWHHESHYQGALRAFVKLDADPRGDHRKRVAKANSALMHELYFANMAADKTSPGTETARALKARFGSFDRWAADFGAAARSCRGWAVLVRHPVNGRLYNVSSDSHDDGPPWSGVPLLAVDVYEHSYYLDFQNRKGDYVDGFMNHIAWPVVEDRLKACLG